MSAVRDLLIEIGTEELPPKALKRLSEAFTNGVTAGLAKAEVARGEVTAYATPRRLVVLVRNVVGRQPDKEVERRGPALNAAYKPDGMPTPAAVGFARSCGVEVEQLATLETDKGAWLVFRKHEPGRATAELMPDIVRQALEQLPVPKRMRWGAGTAEFVRPVHWVVLLFGNEVIPAEILSVQSGRETRGHRFHHPHSLYIAEPAAYAPMLETEGRVVADFAARREAIRGQVMELAVRAGGCAVIDEELLDEVASMVEWPVAVLGNFEPRFLDVPAEALISTMKANQKYFHVVDAQGQLMPHFITVANIDSHDVAQVRAGNERVVRPRLADAAFFWNQDRRQPLSARLESLKNVVFQQKLGTLYDKSERVARLATRIAAQLGGNPDYARQAAFLAKCDLMTAMVGEFPELQGIMGRYYARHDREPEEIAQALDEQYMPRFAGDRLPQGKTGQALAIADRIDTLVGIFGIGQTPTGDKDPYALRRAALGLLRTVIENGLSQIDLRALLIDAVENFTVVLASVEIADEVYEFMMERLRAYYAEQGVAPDVFEAVLALRPARPYDFDRRVRAVAEFRDLPEAASLTAANKRIHNILRQAHEEGKVVADHVDVALLHEPAEKALAERLAALAAEVTPLLDKLDYTAALTRLAGLREAVDGFFDHVMVMVEDERLRHNRLALLNGLRRLFLRVADVSRLQG